jgi:CheY-like chemotaxis protein
MARSGIAAQPRKRVVIVDDSKTMQAVLDQIFSLRMGFDVVGLANDATSAASLIRSLRPDLVTIDLCMPYIDGCKLLEMLSDLPDVRKVIVSGQVRDNLAMTAKLEDAGADACVDKSDLSRDPSSFCATIAAVLARPLRRKTADGAKPVVPISPAIGGYPVPADEQARLAALRFSGLTNDLMESQLDLLTAHMGKTTDFPTCLMTFIDRNRQWIKSAYGFDRGSTTRAAAFCNYTLCADDVFMVSNAANDPRFAANPFVAGDPGIRTYVGCPIVSSTGVRLGALCLIDNRPRVVTPNIITNLRSISTIATAIIEGRRPALADAA